jgi:hypothetical protein
MAADGLPPKLFATAAADSVLLRDKIQAGRTAIGIALGDSPSKAIWKGFETDPKH